MTEIAASGLPRRAAQAVASLFGVGLFPFAPGTLASAIGLAAGAWLIHAAQLALPESLLAIAVVGLLAVEHSGAAGEDPGWIVIDEVAGMWLAMTPLTHVSPLGLALAFVLFRLLDIFKPGPVGWVDRKHNAGAVMGDDLVAGAITAAILQALIWQFPHLL